MFKNEILRVLHWGPLITLGIILSVSLCTVSCLGQWHNNRETFLNLARAAKRRADEGSQDDLYDQPEPEPTSWSVASPYVLVVFLALSCSTLYYYLRAMWGGPGVVPPNWAPAVAADRQLLQYCTLCQSYKPPRAHHCRQCRRCILKMDHHCPWINNCVGHRNHAHFALFLSFAVIGCSVATFVLAPSVYWALYRRWYLVYGTGHVPVVFLSLWGLLVTMFVLGLAMGVVAAVGLLLYFQVRGLRNNRTAIEDWILEKAQHRRKEDDLPPFVFPYDLGTWANLRVVFSNVWCTAEGDGIYWDVCDGCHQYTLTEEQLQQKADKRRRAVLCGVVRGYGGSWVPVTHGGAVCLHPPCSDEPRIPLAVGERVSVTRWKKYWLYGDCVAPENPPAMGDAGTASPTTKKAPRRRGWFPRHCVVPLLTSSYRGRPQQEEEEAPDEELKWREEEDPKMEFSTMGDDPRVGEGRDMGEDLHTGEDLMERERRPQVSEGVLRSRKI